MLRKVRGESVKMLYELLRIEQRVTNVTYVDVFHPDKQGKPESMSYMDGSAKRLYVCPVCFFETKVFTEIMVSWTVYGLLITIQP